ncbi:hypothetical protein [Sinorhizobium sp. BG8]|uniref:hypothetical protein n=1 Tax=Sinorhizobium sp. BG8 TaxID=2613773 RepID=UPI00193C87C0|nr:hypothetical protein [Sinorhizobium sp. BG8]QRM56538.1 hypothetical protein F3Y30_19870 [Sinorhizobium sp. BG8]
MQKQVIEIGGEAVGVVVPDNDRLKFVAVKYHVWDLDSQRFGSADEVRAAIRQLMSNSAHAASKTPGIAAA